MKIVLLQNIEAAIADDNTGELETLNELLTAKQKELVKLAQAKKDYSALADEVDRLKEKKQKLLVAKADTEGFKKRISELEEYLIEANEELTEYDESMVRKYIQEIKIYEDRFKVCFKAGIELDIPRLQEFVRAAGLGLAAFFILILFVVWNIISLDCIVCYLYYKRGLYGIFINTTNL